MNPHLDLDPGSVPPRRQWGIPVTASNQEVLAVQRDQMAEQNDMMGVLHESVKRQKVIGEAMLDEQNEHTKLLESIQDHVDSAGNKVERATQHVEKVTRSSSARILWGIIAFLSCVLIGVVLAAIGT